MKAGMRSGLTHGILALSSAGLTVQTCLQAGFPVRWSYVAIVFFSTWFVYRLAWYGLKWPFKPGQTTLLIIVLSMAGIALFIPSLPADEIAGLLIMFIFCLVYFAEKGMWRGLRSVTFVKSIWVALVWTVVTAWIPLSLSLEDNHLCWWPKDFYI